MLCSVKEYNGLCICYGSFDLNKALVLSFAAEFKVRMCVYDHGLYKDISILWHDSKKQQVQRLTLIIDPKDLG